ncbi:MAG: YraN family protein [Candidatus Margulisiibacteriota bacterium]
MNKSTRELGYEGESIAQQYLEKHGYQIIDNNFTVKGGEIDLIAYEGGYLVFIEVKNHSREDYGTMLQKINKKKQGRIAYAAKVYLARRGNMEIPCRFDVIAILNMPDGQKDIELIKDAFRVEYRV